MFTGIVEGCATVRAVSHRNEAAELVLEAETVVAGTTVGDSISVNGCCLTVTGIDGETLRFDLGTETLARTTLGALAVGDQVNVERALAVGDRIGGHLVQGHVDGIGRVVAVDRQPGHTLLTVDLPSPVWPLATPKGSVTLDGVSLTVAAVDQPGRVTVSLIPHTEAVTTLGQRDAGDALNVEADMIARHVATLLQHHAIVSDRTIAEQP